MHYLPLDTEKYYLHAVRENQRQLKRLRNRQAVRDFMTFLYALVLIGLGATFIKWMPEIVAYFHI